MKNLNVMKRLMALVLAAALVLSISGCTADENSHASSTHTGKSIVVEASHPDNLESSVEESSVESSIEESESSVPEVETQTYIFSGIEFQLPARWVFNAEYSNSTEQFFFGGRNDSLPICFFMTQEMEELPAVLTDEFTNALIEAFASSYSKTRGDCENITETKAAGYPALYFDIPSIEWEGDVDAMADFRMLFIFCTSENRMVECGILVPEGEQQELLDDIPYLVDHAKKTTAPNNMVGQEEESSAQPESSSQETNSAPESSTSENVPAEYKQALDKAQQYADNLHLSKQDIYDQLTSQYGDGMSDEAAQYAVEHVQADWNKNALETARSYQDLGLSESDIYDQLVSEYGGQFTPEQAQYAIDHLD